MLFGDATLPARFWSKVVPEPNTGCWLWTAGADRDGYGVFWWRRATCRAHRVTYEAVYGPVPEELVLDHVLARGCGIPSCVNPDHVEPVTSAENTARMSPAGRARRYVNGRRRGAATLAKTTCPAGHPYAGANLHLRKNGTRSCRACNRDAMRVRRAAGGSS